MEAILSSMLLGTDVVQRVSFQLEGSSRIRGDFAVINYCKASFYNTPTDNVTRCRLCAAGPHIPIHCINARMSVFIIVDAQTDIAFVKT